MRAHKVLAREYRQKKNLHCLKLGQIENKIKTFQWIS
jgi:hypothetical protein